MKSVTFMVKPASSRCNLRCGYCFYDDVSEQRQLKSMGRMTEETALRLIAAGYEAGDADGTMQILFQGGEPTLAGLDFFRFFVEAAERRRPPGVRLGWSIQTNGMLLTEEWAALLRDHGFLVGLSLDGTRGLHDRYRTDPQGKGTWHRALRALELLNRAEVETNLLCVVTGPAARSPQKLYSSLRKLGDYPLQFIPCLDPLQAARGTLPYSLTPRDYGRFLCLLFDCWYRDWEAGACVSVRSFDDCLRLLLGLPPGSCAAAGRCGNYLVVEGDGSLYPCDFFVLDEWRLGNIRDTAVEAALASPAGLAFQRRGESRPQPCGTCPYAAVCRGGCPRDWAFSGAGPEHYYCEALRAFFSHALPRLQRVAQQLRR